jgi:oxalate decarboxylase/phosphoglucose isomerase-like protein (cupin superfamily)
MKMIEGPLTQHGTLLSLYEALGSGAPMHMHKDAFNVLAYGEKRWLLLPPRDAVYSAEPISEWLAAAPARGNGTSACTQRAGDVIFVRRGWGHAVLNMRTSVGIALEFSAVTGLPM